MPLSATHPASPITRTPCLRIHKSKLEQMASVFGPLWQAENDCLAVKHPIVASKLKTLQQSHSEATAAVEQAVADGPCCEDCQRTADEWARFEAERPSHLDDVDNLDAIDRELQAEKDAFGNIDGGPSDLPSPASSYRFAPPMNHLDGCKCERCIHVALVVAKDEFVRADTPGDRHQEASVAMTRAQALVWWAEIQRDARACSEAIQQALAVTGGK